MRYFNQHKSISVSRDSAGAEFGPRSASPFTSALLFLVMASLVLISSPGSLSAQVASESPPEELMEYFNKALQNNPGLGMYQSRIDAGEQLERQAGSLPDPEINLGFFINPAVDTQFLGRFSISAMQMFPWFGTLGAGRDQQRYLTDAEQQLYNDAALELFRNLHRAWLDIAELRAIIELTKEESDLLDNLRSQIQTRFETARASQVDLLYVELEQERLQTRIENLESRLPAMYVRFNSLLGRSPGTEVDAAGFQSRELVAIRSEIAELSKQRSPGIRSLEAGYASMESGIDRNRRMGLPEFGLGLEVMGRDFSTMTMMDNMNEAYIAMATIRLPLWRGKYDGRRDELRARQRGLEYEIESERLEIDQNVSRYITSYEEAGREMILIEERIIPRIDRMYRLLLESYIGGSTDFNELIGLRRELLAQRIAHTEFQFERERALTDIEREAAVHITIVE